MSALIPAFARSRGRVDPAVFGHVIRLVQHDYMSATHVEPQKVVAGRRSHSALMASTLPERNLNRVFGSRGTIPLSRHRRYSASAQAVEVEIDDQLPSHDPAHSFPLTSLKRPHLTRQEQITPTWAQLPPSLSESLSDGSITSPTQFRTEFDRLECKSGQLASIDTLQPLFSLFLSAAEPSQWAWLSGQLGHMLAAVSNADVFHPDVSALGQSMRAYCLAELGQDEEARGILDAGMTSRRSSLAVDHSVRALVLLRVGEKEAGIEQMIKAIRRGISPAGVGYYLTSTLADCIARFARDMSDDEMLHIMRQSGHRLRQLLTSAEERGHNRAFVSIWAGWLAELPISFSLYDDSPHLGHYLRHLHFSILVRDTTRAEDAHSLFIEICNRGRMVDLHPQSIKRLARMLREQGLVPEADSVGRATNLDISSPREALTEQLRIHTRADGDHHSAGELWTQIRADHVPLEVERFAIAELRARNGDLAGTREVFDETSFPNAAARQRRSSILLRAAIAAKVADAAEGYLVELLEFSLDPRSINEVLQLMSALDELDRAESVFNTFAQVGLSPDLHAYTTMIGIHARHRKLDEAEALFQSLVDQGIKPDGTVWSAMLNAYVEAGDWDGASQRWSELKEEVRISPEVISVVMKALVLKGTNPSRVLDMFRLLEQPTNHHWALLLQSAADSGQHHSMEGLFSEMQARSARDSEAAKPDVYAYTVLLHTYLKSDNPTRSREVYDEMLRNEIVPSSVTYSMIISSYAKGSNSSGFQRAEDFAMSIYRLSSKSDQSSIDAGIRLPKGRKAENLLGPLVVAAGRANETRLASHYFDLITKDAEPSILMFTRYLDVWRRAGESNMVVRVWADIFALACRTISLTSTPTFPYSRTSVTRQQRQPDNVLVMPLTIVLITLGRDKRLLDIRRVWDEVRSAGFGFDPTNFNQLAISLAQSGDVEGAFDVVENVLAESLEHEHGLYEAEATSAVFSDAPGASFAGPDELATALGDNTTNPMFRPPNRRHEAADNIITSSPASSIAEHLSAPIHENIWRPHYRTLATLDSVISQLETRQDKRAWLGLATTEEAEDDLDVDVDPESESSGTVVDLPEFGTCVRDPVDGRPRKTSARGLLMKLNRKYSKAMALVMFHRKKQGARRPRQGMGGSRRAGH